MPLRFSEIAHIATRKGLRLERTEQPGWFRLRCGVTGAELRTNLGCDWTLAHADRYLAGLPTRIPF